MGRLIEKGKMPLFDFMSNPTLLCSFYTSWPSSYQKPFIYQYLVPHEFENWIFLIKVL